MKIPRNEPVHSSTYNCWSVSDHQSNKGTFERALFLTPWPSGILYRSSRTSCTLLHYPPPHTRNKETVSKRACVLPTNSASTLLARLIADMRVESRVLLDESRVVALLLYFHQSLRSRTDLLPPVSVCSLSVDVISPRGIAADLYPAWSSIRVVFSKSLAKDHENQLWRPFWWLMRVEGAHDRRRECCLEASQPVVGNTRGDVEYVTLCVHENSELGEVIGHGALSGISKVDRLVRKISSARGTRLTRRFA